MSAPKYTYTFSDWENGYRRENAPPDEVLDNLPAPIRYTAFRPAWGKGGDAARKAHYTRQAKKRALNQATFAEMVLPALLDSLDDESLHDAGLLLKRADLLARSGRTFWALEQRGQWIGGTDDLRSDAAKNMGAAPITHEEYLAKWHKR